MDQHRRRIDQVKEPSFVADLRDISTDELRERRQTCDEVEKELSYYRRMLHGRMDLLAFEMRRRRGDETRSLLEALPEILADASSGETREAIPRAIPIETPDLPTEGRRTIDHVLEDDFLAQLPSLEDDELERIQTTLTDVEREVSQQRRAVYEAYETINTELTRRYREGLADVDELLQQH